MKKRVTYLKGAVLYSAVLTNCWNHNDIQREMLKRQVGMSAVKSIEVLSR